MYVDVDVDIDAAIVLYILIFLRFYLLALSVSEPVERQDISRLLRTNKKYQTSSLRTALRQKILKLEHLLSQVALTQLVCPPLGLSLSHSLSLSLQS